MTEPLVDRSALMMPMVTERFVAAAWTRGADAIILDLEDSVPMHLKHHARRLVKDAIALVSRGGARVHVRLNHATAVEELDDVVWPGVSLLMYAKTETAQEVRLLDERISVLEEARGIPPGSIELTAIIETPRGVANAMDIVQASTRIVRFGGGAGYDMGNEYKVDIFTDTDPWLYTKGECELAGRAAGAAPSMSVFLPNPEGSVSDAAWTRSQALASMRCGARGGVALHPGVVEALTTSFTPAQDDLVTARTVLLAYHRLCRTRETWTRAGDLVVDRYEAERARELLWWGVLCRQRDDEKREALARAEGVT
ncbi:CoA ester lyase [Blastococcus sp. URHD0036]|uniref:HpcH/HpaI aldolase/citrate lyase family protein n=1 Tax=Blastococcus sp. URHD0036 TaxID=1380356 RepID=UPI000690FC64|nr:aldolase/citrate lyase family protein [Blastococcus sp. URHD0036]